MITYHFVAETPEFNKKDYTDWITQVISGKGQVPGELTYIFCSDEYLWEMNRKFLKHDYYTDIITFPIESPGSVSGDLYISIDRVKENAVLFGAETMVELRRVMIHGVLHLMGWTDETPGTKGQMRVEEDAALQMFHVKH